MSPSPPARMLTPGEPAPWFECPVLDGSSRWVFSSIGGVPCLLFLYGSASHPQVATALSAINRRRELFDDVSATFFGVTVDPGDAQQGRIAQQLPGIRHFLDYEGNVSTRYGAIEGLPRDGANYRPHFLVLDQTLQVAARFPVEAVGEAIDAVAALRQPAQDWAPVLIVPRIFEPEMCTRLVAAYENGIAEPSGFMRQIEGKTVLVKDPAFKRRSDHVIEDATLLDAARHAMLRRLRPMVQRAFQFDPTRVERYIVARYDAESSGFFRAHRDNTTKGTAHRRFAVTINLNDDYSGGDLRFPEYGRRTYRAPVGGAVVFSCSLLHEATTVTAGRRYAFLPFLYDEAGAKLREDNLKFIDTTST